MRKIPLALLSLALMSTSAFALEHNQPTVHYQSGTHSYTNYNNKTAIALSEKGIAIGKDAIAVGGNLSPDEVITKIFNDTQKREEIEKLRSQESSLQSKYDLYSRLHRQVQSADAQIAKNNEAISANKESLKRVNSDIVEFQPTYDEKVKIINDRLAIINNLDWGSLKTDKENNMALLAQQLKEESEKGYNFALDYSFYYNYVKDKYYCLTELEPYIKLVTQAQRWSSTKDHKGTYLSGVGISQANTLYNKSDITIKNMSLFDSKAFSPTWDENTKTLSFHESSQQDLDRNGTPIDPDNYNALVAKINYNYDKAEWALKNTKDIFINYGNKTHVYFYSKYLKNKREWDLTYAKRRLLFHKKENAKSEQEKKKYDAEFASISVKAEKLTNKILNNARVDMLNDYVKNLNYYEYEKILTKQSFNKKNQDNLVAKYKEEMSEVFNKWDALQKQKSDIENQIADKEAENARLNPSAENRKQAKKAQATLDELNAKKEEIQGKIASLELVALQDLGHNSIAFGTGAFASGNNSLAIMADSQATGDRSIAIGTEAIANANDTIVIGNGSQANVPTIIMGNNNSVTNDPNRAGTTRNNRPKDHSPVVMGNFADVSQPATLTLGNNTQNHHFGAVVLGFESVSGEVHEVPKVDTYIASRATDGAAPPSNNPTPTLVPDPDFNTTDDNKPDQPGTPTPIIFYDPDDPTRPEKPDYVERAFSADDAPKPPVPVPPSDSDDAYKPNHPTRPADPVFVLSVGNGKIKRQVQNMAPGLVAEDSTDGINGSQLWAVTNDLNTLTRMIHDSNKANNLAIKYTNNKRNEILLGNQHRPITEHPYDGDPQMLTKIIGLKPGRLNMDSSEAVNGSQLWASNKMIAKVLGEGFEVYPKNEENGKEGYIHFTYKDGDVTYNNLMDALNAKIDKKAGASSDLAKTVKKATEDMKGLKKDLNTFANHSKDIASLKKNMAGNSKIINVNRINISDLTGKVNKNTAEIALLKTDVANFKTTDVGTLKTEMTKTSKTVKELEKTTTELQNTSDSQGKRITFLEKDYNVLARHNQVLASEIVSLKDGQNALFGQVRELGENQKASNARMAALSALHPLDYDGVHKTIFTAGTGYDSGKFAFALGMHHYFTPDAMVSAGASYCDHLTANLGLSLRLGKSGEKVNVRSTLQDRVLQLEKQLQELKK